MKLKKNIGIILIMLLTLSTLILGGCNKNEDTKGDTTKDESTQEDTIQTEENTASTIESTTESTVESTVESTTDAEKEKVTSEATGKKVITVNDATINLDELMYYIYSIEQEGNYYDQMYQSTYGTSYWDSEAEEGVTMREMAKNYVSDTAVMYEILYDKAVAAKYTLTDEEKASCVSYADQIYEALTVEQLKVTGLMKDVVVKVYEKMTLAEKYYTFITDGLNIDKKAITAGVKAEDYKQYDTKCLYVATSKYDEANKAVEMTAEELKTAEKSIDKALKSVKAGDDFATIVAADKTVLTNDITFVSGDQTVAAEYEKAAIALKANKFSDVVKTAEGYYIIQLVDNTSTASYDTAVADAIAVVQSEGFNKEYEKLKKEYNIKIDEKVWDAIIMGETTIVVAK